MGDKMEKNGKNKSRATRRKVLQRSAMVIPTVMTFAIPSLKAHASGIDPQTNRPSPYAPLNE